MTRSAPQPPTRPHLLGLLPPALADHLRRHGIHVRDAEARRIVAHAVAQGRDGFPSARPVPQRVAEAVSRLVDRQTLVVLERAEDPTDGFVKYLFRLGDGALVEAVRIPLEAPGRFSVCLSSQVGCAMGCSFCATGRLGFTRNLQPWEMVAQLVAIRDEAPGRVTGVLFQGQGEPLANLDAVLAAADVIAHPCGGRIAAESITLSTVGAVPGILRMARERRRERLIISLTSAVEARRRGLLPAAAAWPLTEVAAAVRAYQRAMGGRVRIAWVVLGGVNTGDDEVEALTRLLGDIPVRINLIDVNDPRPEGFRRASEPELVRFWDALAAAGFPVVRRYSGGAARHAACGMLASTRLAG